MSYTFEELSEKLTKDIGKSYFGIKAEVVKVRDNCIYFVIKDKETGILITNGYLDGDQKTVMYTENILIDIKNRNCNIRFNAFIDKVFDYSLPYLYSTSNIDEIITSKRCRNFIRKIYLNSIEAFLNNSIPLESFGIEHDIDFNRTEITAINNILNKDCLKLFKHIIYASRFSSNDDDFI